MKKVIYLLLSFMIIVLVHSGCNSRPSGVLSLEKMKVVYLHHLMAEEMINNSMGRDTIINMDSLKVNIYNGLLRFHKIDSTTFSKSLEYYRSDIERFKELADSTEALANRERKIRNELIESRTADTTSKKAASDTSIAEIE